MTRKILVSGKRADFTILEFDTSQNTLCRVADYPAPTNASWVEHSSKHGNTDFFIGLSEEDEAGLLYTFEIDHAQRSCVTTSTQPTLGAPGHCQFLSRSTRETVFNGDQIVITLLDRSSVALITYYGGSIALYPIAIDSTERLTLKSDPRTEVLPDFPYKSTGHGPNRIRQRQCHVHQVLETSQGLLYAPDLGSDRVWILCRDAKELEIVGWLQCPPGTGTRHAVFSPDENMLYVIGELSHNIIAFDLRSAPAENIQPIEGFSPNVIPPTVLSGHQAMMDASEICLHPTIRNVVYVSNRWERHIAQREPHLQNTPTVLPPGDSVAIVLLSPDGKRTEDVRHVRTNVDVIRGMRLSDDGKHVVVLGQEGGGVEIYEISGSRGEVWTLTAALVEGLEGGLKHAVWL